MITKDSEDRAAEGDIFQIHLSFKNIPKPPIMKSRDGSIDLILSDMLIVGRVNSEILVDIPRKFSDIAYFIEDEGQQPAKVKYSMDINGA